MAPIRCDPLCDLECGFPSGFSGRILFGLFLGTSNTIRRRSDTAKFMGRGGLLGTKSTGKIGLPWFFVVPFMDDASLSHSNSHQLKLLMSGFLLTQLNITRSELSRTELTMLHLGGSFPVTQNWFYRPEMLCACHARKKGQAPFGTGSTCDSCTAKLIPAPSQCWVPCGMPFCVAQ